MHLVMNNEPGIFNNNKDLCKLPPMSVRLIKRPQAIATQILGWLALLVININYICRVYTYNITSNVSL